MPELLRIATVQFAETYDPRHNAAVIRRYMQKAVQQGADVVHFHEAALTGYLTQDDAPALEQINWEAVRQAGREICQEAARLGVWVALGSSHPLTPPHKPTNCLYLIGPDGTVRDRYDKRFCTESDLRVYTPGDHFVTFELKGWTCGLLICFDLRFPELYRRLYRQGVRVVFQSFHNARYDGPGVHGKIMRQTLQADAAHNGMWISAPNSSARYSRWPSVFITPDGVIAGQLRQNRAGMMMNEANGDQEFYDPMKRFRDDVLAGKLHTGEPVEDPRLDDRASL